MKNIIIRFIICLIIGLCVSYGLMAFMLADIEVLSVGSGERAVFLVLAGLVTALLIVAHNELGDKNGRNLSNNKGY